jgi:hypothetical protein
MMMDVWIDGGFFIGKKEQIKFYPVIYNGMIGYEVYPRTTTHVAPLWRENDARHFRGNGRTKK